MSKHNVKSPVLLVVLDGWGIDEAKENNGVAMAQTPCYDSLIAKYPTTQLQASGEHVGLPDGQIGNSEVGHTTIGAGTVLYQDLVRIGKDVADKTIGSNPAFIQAFNHAVDNDSQLHVMGLLSTGGVHSHEDHFIEIIEAAVRSGVKKVVAHPFLDGRDSNRTDGSVSLQKLEEKLSELGAGRIATVIGRYYAMDRDKNWDRTDMAAAAIIEGKAQHVHSDTLPSRAIADLYEAQTYDELIEPHVFLDADGEASTLQDNDSLIFTNFRTDRTRQLSNRIQTQVEPKNLCFVTMTNYGNEVNSIVAYEPASIEETLGSVIAAAGLKQAHLAETEKFAHATYFLNGGREHPHDQEEHVLIPSNKDVKTHDEKPEMKAKEICDAAIERLTTNDFIFINFANPDMVGHTANQPAIITAVETVDRELARLSDAVLACGGSMVVIADHGNAERMIDPETGNPHTAHTNNPVPCILVSEQLDGVTLRAEGDPGLKDVAPTVLDLMGLEQPSCMTGESLIN
jgi:2,3-bisphosphoglycerate-independent phosphoglycerate mutase